MRTIAAAGGVWLIAGLAVAPATPSDRFVDLDGHRVQVAELGSARPLVVFVAGLGEELLAQCARIHVQEVGALVLVDPEDQRLHDRLAPRLPLVLRAQRQAALAEAMPDLAAMPRARHEWVPGSRHYIQNNAPDKVVAAIPANVQIVRDAH